MLKKSTLAFCISTVLLSAELVFGQVIVTTDFSTGPDVVGPNLFRDSNTKNTWVLDDQTDIFYDGTNQWVENNSDSRSDLNMLYIAGDAPVYTPGDYVLSFEITNDEIVTGSANTQTLDYAVIGISGAGSWGATDSINIGALPGTSIPTNGTYLTTGQFDLAVNESPSVIQVFASSAFSIAAGYDDILIHFRVDGVGASTATDEFVRVHGVDLSVAAIPEPSTYAALAGALALGLVILRRRRNG